MPEYIHQKSIVWITEVRNSTNPELAGKFLLFKLWHHCAALLFGYDLYFPVSISHINFILNHRRFFSHIEIYNTNLSIAHPAGPMLIWTITSI